MAGAGRKARYRAVPRPNLYLTSKPAAARAAPAPALLYPEMFGARLVRGTKLSGREILVVGFVSFPGVPVPLLILSCITQRSCR